MKFSEKDEKALNAAKFLKDYCEGYINCEKCFFHYRNIDNIVCCSLNSTPSHYKIRFAEMNLKKE